MKLQYSFRAFVATVAYLLLKRFYLWEFLYAAYFLLYVFVTYAFEFILLPLVSFGSHSASKGA